MIRRKNGVDFKDLAKEDDVWIEYDSISQWKSEHAASSNRNTPDVVILNNCYWDQFEGTSLSTYNASLFNFKNLLHQYKMEHPNVTMIWRSCYPYAYPRLNDMTGYHMIEKDDVIYVDSWSLLKIRREMSQDSVHYRGLGSNWIYNKIC